MQKRKMHNVAIIAENNGDKPGFNIYLIFSGEKRFLMWHEHNGLLFNLLKDGISVEKLVRKSPKNLIKPKSHKGKTERRRADHLIKSLKHVVATINNYFDLEALYRTEQSTTNFDHFVAETDVEASVA